jgi:hypothetical protein
MLQQYDLAIRDRYAKFCALEQRYQKIFKADDEPDDDVIDNDRDDSGDNGGNSEPRHVVDELADLLVEGGSPDGEVTREQALRWLLHSTRGQALVARMAQHRKQNRKDLQMPTRQEVLKGYLKAAGGLDGLAAQIVKKGTTTVSEAELVGMITAEARSIAPNLSEAQAFSRLYTDASPRSLRLRQAIAVCKAAPLEIMPVSVGGADAIDAADADPAKATAQMERLVAEQIKRSPEMTRSAAWDVVVRENPTLAAAAIRRPVANEKMLYPFPR